MIKSANEIQARAIEIDLTGPQGNAFYLLGAAERLAKQCNLDPEEIQNEMKQGGNYEKLVEVFERYFGYVVTIYR